MGDVNCESVALTTHRLDPSHPKPCYTVPGPLCRSIASSYSTPTAASPGRGATGGSGAEGAFRVGQPRCSSGSTESRSEEEEEEEEEGDDGGGKGFGAAVDLGGAVPTLPPMLPLPPAA